jgi:hypothetical protein
MYACEKWDFLCLFFPTTILQQLNNGQVVEDKWKFVQFAIIFSLLSKGKPMINYDNF